MRTVCPYTQLQPLAERALARFAPDADCVYLGVTSLTAYHGWLCEMWAAGEGFLLVEHDTEIHATVLPELTACPEPWCLFPYNGPGAPESDRLLQGALGCTRFSTALLQAQPGFMASIPTRNWQRMDCEILPRLRTLGYEPHIHMPPVLHHHIYDGLCACGGNHE